MGFFDKGIATRSLETPKVARSSRKVRRLVK